MAEKKLEKYQKKRNFSVTQEPAGELKREKQGERLRFSVQRHKARADHFDLRLEYGGVALSWAVPKGPSYSVLDKRLAMRVEDHPVDYMDFEGIIPKGEYGGGTVMLWDEGEWIPRISPEKGLKEGSLKFFLDGKRLKGNWALVRMKKREDERGEPWLFLKEHDEFERSSPCISRFTRSVRSDKTMQEIAKKGQTNPFNDVMPMLAMPCAALPKGKGWIYELKYDGHRTLGFVENGHAVLKTRNGHDCTASFPAVKSALETLFKERAAVVDGEAVFIGADGVPDFSALQAHLKRKESGKICYVLFDLLSLDGKDLRDRPLSERKKRLKALFPSENQGAALAYSSHTTRLTSKEMKAVEEKGLEGIVAKRADSKYRAERNGDWQKFKFRRRQEFVIGGFSLNEAGTLSSLLLGFYERGKLTFAGKVGTGFTKADKDALLLPLKRTLRKTSPFQNLKTAERGIYFVSPKLLAEVEFAEITQGGLLRQASFLGIRSDKSPKSVTLESKPREAEPREAETKKRAKVKSHKEAADKAPSKESGEFFNVKLTHGDKVMFPQEKITKRDLAKYYEAAAEKMLPYLKGRILSLVCCPSGIEGETFFRKHLEGRFRGVGMTKTPTDAEFFVTGKAGILSLVQYNAVEFHLRASGKNAEKPDIMVFDLDPDEGLPLSKVVAGAKELKSVLTGLGLTCFLKTSGGKGYHIVVPFSSGGGGEKFKEFSKKTALLLEQSFPSLFTSNLSKKARRGKIFLDFQRNSPKATSVAPYSVRARAHAPISMPIAWEDLGVIAPQAVTIKNAAEYLFADPWKDFFSVKKRQKLK